MWEGMCRRMESPAWASGSQQASWEKHLCLHIQYSFLTHNQGVENDLKCHLPSFSYSSPEDSAKLAGDQEIHPRSFIPDQIISSQIPDHQSPEFGLLLPAKAKAGGVWFNDDYKEWGWRGRGRRPAEDRLVQACAVS